MGRRKGSASLEQPSSIGHRRRLRERLQRCGIESFAPHEVVELLLTYAIPRRDVKGTAKLLIGRFGSLCGALEASEFSLRKVFGVGTGVADFLHLIRDTAKLYLQQRIYPPKPAPANWRESLRELWRTRLGGERKECLEIAYLDSQMNLLPPGVERLVVDEKMQLTFLPRQIVARVLNRHCAAIILCCNRLDGNELPSEHDERAGRAIAHALQLLDVRMLDIWIVAGDKIFSLNDQCSF
ncbi:MAG: hypothetical protein LBP65_03605 [Puniceicoccales bacterium]|nr:hypothetical protein [Puniceicoccales bacterium]